MQLINIKFYFIFVEQGSFISNKKMLPLNPYGHTEILCHILLFHTAIFGGFKGSGLQILNVSSFVFKCPHYATLIHVLGHAV